MLDLGPETLLKIFEDIPSLLDLERGQLLSFFDNPWPKMSDNFQPRTMKRKNMKNLALSAAQKTSGPSASDSQLPGARGNAVDTLEIGVEFQLDLKADELVVLRELGAGNGGTVSKVEHPATKIIMARKVRLRRRPKIVGG